MNTALNALGLFLLLRLGYFAHGRFLGRRLVEPDDGRPVPAVAQRNGVDYVPAITPVLFGHHLLNVGNTCGTLRRYVD